MIKQLTALVLVIGLFGNIGVCDADQSSIPEPNDSKVHVLSYDNYYRFLERHPLILMEFYAPWCTHCQELAPHYREAAKVLHGLDLPTPVVLAKYNDGDEYNRRLRAGSPEMYNYSAYPALLVFQDGEHEFYRGGRQPEDIVFYMSALAKGLDPLKEEEKQRPGLYKKEPHYDPSLMIDLEPEFFNETVLSKSKHNNVLWIVEFYSDRCPFCQSLAPEIEKAAHALKKKFPDSVRIGGVNSRIYHDLAERHGITGYPWVTSFYMGEKVEDMAGLGGAESVINWGTSKHAEVWKKGNGEDIPYDNGVEKALASLKNGGAHTSKSNEKQNVEVSSSGESATEGVDISTLDLEDMISYAMEYNIMSLKNVQKMRQAVRKRKTTEEKAKIKVFKKIEPLLRLLKEAGKI
eukprot:g3551.t1